MEEATNGKNQNETPDASPVKQLKPESLKKNFYYQTIYQVVLLVIPFLTAPFVTRRLGDFNLGNYAYVNSIASYFVTFAGLGISLHGVRLMATCKDDPEKFRHSFWSLYLVHFFISIFTMAVYLCVCLFMKDSADIYWIESLYVLSAAFDITWLFTGLERFKGTVLCNLAVKVVATALIFILIKDENDIDIYVWIQAGSTLLGQAILLPWAFRNIKPVKVSAKECFAHIKPMLVFFIGSVAVALYTTFDKTLLGLEATKQSVAYYTYADRIISIPRSIMAVVTTVTISRVCVLLDQQKFDEARKYIHFSLLFVTFLGVGTLAGILGIGHELAVVYYGSAFAESGNMLLIMSPLPYIILVGTIARQECLIPMHFDVKAEVILIISAVLNLAVSAILIPLVGPYGAIYGTIIAETIGTILDVYFSRKLIRVSEIIKTFIPFALFGGVMYLVLFFLQKIWNYSVLHLLLLIFIGFAVYCLLSFVYLLFFSRDKKIFKTFLEKRFFKGKVAKNPK